MDDRPRQTLREIIARYGPSIYEDPRRCRALLLDLAGEYRTEVFVLVSALEEGVVTELRARQPGVPLGLLLGRLVRRLEGNRAMDEEAARWAVESWAFALGISLPAQPARGSHGRRAPAQGTGRAKPLRIPPGHPQPNPPVLFSSTWKVDVLGRPEARPSAAWQKIGATPGTVPVPSGYDLGLRPRDVDGDALGTWVRELPDARRVRGLELSRGTVTTAGLAHLDALTRLVSLDLSDTDVTDAGLARVATLTMLTALDLSRCKWITDAGLAQLRALTRLAKLGLSGTNLSDAGLGHLARITRLTSVDVSKTGISDAGSAPLAVLGGLTSLNLARTSITNAGLARLRSLTDLVNLDLSGTRVTNTGLPYLAAFRGLTFLYLSQTQVTDKGLRYLRALTELNYLDLSGTRTTDAGVRNLASLDDLTFLYLSQTQITDRGLAYLRALPKLAILNVSDTRVTRAGVASVERPGLHVSWR